MLHSLPFYENLEHKGIIFIMYKNKGSYVYSPSDLTVFMESPFASWMSRFKRECPSAAPEPDADDALMGSLQERGYAYEKALVEQFRQKSLTVIEIDGSDNDAKITATLAAMDAGVDVIFQGLLAEPPFQGFADFLVKVPGQSSLGDYHYEVWDTKLSSSVKPTFVIQLCCYADMLEHVQGVRPDCLTVALGNGEQQVLRTDDYFHYYTSLKQRFLVEQEQFDASSMP